MKSSGLLRAVTISLRVIVTVVAPLTLPFHLDHPQPSRLPVFRLDVVAEVVFGHVPRLVPEASLRHADGLHGEVLDPLPGLGARREGRRAVRR